MTNESNNSESKWQRLHLETHAINAAIDSIVLTPENRGLAYGDGFFTTIGVIDGVILWQSYHVQRLYSHAHALQLAIDGSLLLASLQVHAEQIQQGMIKVIITRTVQSVRGYGFAPEIAGSDCEVWLKATTMAVDTAQHGTLPDGRRVLMQPAIAAVCLTAQLACLPPPLAGLKTLNRLDSVLASGELQRLKAERLASDAKQGTDEGLGIGEGLVRGMSGSWVEGTMSNVFYQLSDSPLAGKSQAQAGLADSKNTASNYLLSGQWFTPSLSQSGVAGVMRQVIIDGFAQSETPVIMRPLNDDDLPNLRALFLCNALRGVIPVTSLTLLSGEVLSF